MLNIGKMDRRLSLERFTQTIEMSGYPIDEWEILDVVWCEVVDATAQEEETDLGEEQTDRLTFRIRYRSDLTTADRVTYEGTGYNLKQIKEVGRRDALELIAEAVK
nr:phage head closure protein [uncultured Cohaesibacter sp.]